MKHVTALLQSLSNDAKLNRQQAAAYTGLSEATLAQDIVTGRHKIPFFKIGRRVIYQKSYLDAWMQSRLVNAPVTHGEGEE